MAWHDNKWNGRVCKNPGGNVYCTGTNSLLADRIANNRDLAIEVANRDTMIGGLPNGYQVPCYWSSNAFSDQAVDIHHTHAFKSIPYKITEKMKPYSVFTWPFKLSFVHDKENQDKYGNYPPDLEKRVDNFIKKFPEKQSVIFFYANYDNPVSADEMKYLLLGCSLIAEKPEKTYFPLSKDELQYWKSLNKMQNFPTINWALQFTHDFKNHGVLLPYHEYLEYVERNPNDEEKLNDMKVVVDEASLVSAFKYVAMDMDDDRCLYLLYKIRKSLYKIEEHGHIANQEEVNKYIDHINKLLKLSWEKRGQYPSLKHIFKHFEMGDASAETVARLINQNAYITSFSGVLAQIEKGEIPEHLAEFEDDLMELFNTRLFKKNIHALKTLTLMNLTEYQIDKIMKNQTLLQEISNNPYVLYEKYIADERSLDNINTQDEVIDFYKIDIALMPDKNFVKKDRILQNMMPDSPQRLRAVITSHLYELGNQSGHCFDVDKDIIKIIKDYPLFYKSDIKIDEEAILSLEDDYKAHFEERLYLNRTQSSNTFYYLKEVKFAEDVIKNAFLRLSKLTHSNGTSGFSEYIRRSIDNLTEKNPKFNSSLFAEERGQLYSNIFEQSFYILTGKAGSGKTEETCKIIDSLTKQLNQSVEILAPTGKAVLRISENLKKRGITNGVAPKTIDKFIHEKDFGGLFNDADYTGILNIKVEDKVRVENIIIDECSMVDLFKMAILFSIIDLDRVKRIILVGDEYQLPPIGFGKPFKDLIQYISDKPEKEKHYIRLESNCRIMEGSATEQNKILELAEVFTSPSPYYEPIIGEVTKGDFESPSLNVYTWNNKEELEQKINTQLEKLLESFGYDYKKGTLAEKSKALNLAFGLYDNGYAKNFSPQEMQLDSVQFLSPYRSGYYGTLALNKHIQAGYRKSYRNGNKMFYHGDKIIRLFNWYTKRSKELLLSNGSIGLVNYGKNGSKYLFSERTKAMEWIDDEENFDLAYAITVHKSQGSDFENVFLVIPQKYALLSKETVYTSITRGKTKLFMFIQENSAEESLLDITRKISFVDRRNTSVFSVPEDKKKMLQPVKGVWVESKVEYIIYKALEQSGLRFKYEEKLKLTHKNMEIKPDFTITLSDGSKIYWEHLGLLNKKDYVKKWQLKREEYCKMGLTNCLITTDDLGGLHEEKVIAIINDIRNNTLRKSEHEDFSVYHYCLY